MMSIWVVMPSCRPVTEAEDCLSRWRGLGYKIAVMRQGDPVEADFHLKVWGYWGWAKAINFLAGQVLLADSSASWIVAAADDYWPDPDHSPEEIAFQCEAESLTRFGFHHPNRLVMQCTGDRWGDNESSRATFGENRGAEIDRIAGSPWMGREWCQRAYQGKGPMPDCYHHLYIDEELQEVATRLGVFWQRRDLIQFHNHPCRKEGYEVYGKGHLAPLYSPEAWTKERTLFESRKAAGFPGSEPLQTCGWRRSNKNA